MADAASGRMTALRRTLFPYAAGAVGGALGFIAVALVVSGLGSTCSFLCRPHVAGVLGAVAGLYGVFLARHP
ncbi:MAG: hypothetical protein HY904_11420 [Deltaproteobacteria bacterium]|nr:hypothetical protein [Deltaproteobacteria bacterium]